MPKSTPKGTWRPHKGHATLSNVGKSKLLGHCSPFSPAVLGLRIGVADIDVYRRQVTCAGL